MLKSQKGLATKNNNRSPKNKKEHAVELGGEPWLPFVLSGVWKIPFSRLNHEQHCLTAVTLKATAGKPDFYRSASHLYDPSSNCFRPHHN
ncbi:MAG: hypothetical protein ACRER8_02690 [Pseudomonas sp.]